MSSPTTIPPSPSPTPTITISTPRLLLRAVLPTDAPGLHAIFSNPDVMRYWSTLPHRTLAETSAWLAKTLTGPQNGVTEFVICLRVSASVPRGPPEAAGPSEVIGKVGIWRTYGESFGGPCGEIGFLLHRAYWRQGLMREAMEVLLPYYFQPVEDGGRGLEAITADTDPRNSASIGFLRGFGFEVTGREEKTFQVGEEWVDSVYLGLRRELWVEREERGTERC